jgi:predicted ATPase
VLRRSPRNLPGSNGAEGPYLGASPAGYARMVLSAASADDRCHIRTPDQRVRVFVSSTLGELSAERSAVRAAIEGLRLTPVMFELGARPHPPRDVYRSYLAQSNLFIGLYWQSYGWVAPEMTVSGIEDEHEACGTTPRLLYVKEPAPERDPRLQALIDRIEADGVGCYRTFSTPEELGELVREDVALALSERFLGPAGPPPTGPPSRQALLPIPTTTMIGRERDLSRVCELTQRDDVRLVTLTGAGGIGKTRLAVACAHELLPWFPGGVRFVSLAPIRDPQLVLGAIAASVGAAEHRRSALDALAAHFGPTQSLLVLDNVEQVLAAAPDLVALLAACPELTLLVTSRARLRVRGEHEYPVPALELPRAAHGDWADQLASGSAVRLFAERARAADPDFALTADNILAVAEICRRLDGLPLAIEIAAARTRLLPPAALLVRLSAQLDCLDALGAGPVDLPDRQRTLRATIDWSYRLLDDESACVLPMLAVFADGWTLEAAAFVTGLDGLDVLELLDQLTGHSLVVAAPTADEPRFRMLETVREYAAELLERRSDAEAIGKRHAMYYCELVRGADGLIRGVDQGAGVLRLEREHGNLRAAVRWLLDHGEGSGAAELMWGAVIGWWLLGRLPEVRAWVHESLTGLDALDRSVQAKLLTTAAIVALEVGEDGKVRSCAEETLALLAGRDEPLVEAVARLFRGYALPSFGDLSGGQRDVEQALTAFRRLDEPFYTGLATTSLGGFMRVAGDISSARRHQEEAITIARTIRNDRLLAQSTTELAVIALLEGRTDEARDLLRRSSELFFAMESAEGLALALTAYARLAHIEGDPSRAATALGAADAAREHIGVVVWPSYRKVEQQLAAELQGALGAEPFESAWEAGRALSPSQALHVAAGSSDVSAG